MVLTCPRCATAYVIDDALVRDPATPVQCSSCQHVFPARVGMGMSPGRAGERTATEGGGVVLTCPRCATAFTLDEAQVRDGSTAVQCSRCQHIFHASAGTGTEAPPPVRQFLGAPRPSSEPPRTIRFADMPKSKTTVPCPDCGAEMPPPEWTGARCPACGRDFPAARPRHHVMLFGVSAPASAPAPHVRAAPAAPVTAPPPPRRKRAPVPIGLPGVPEGVEELYVFAAEHPDDEQALLVLADALMEHGDPRGHLIAFTLQEEQESEVHRKVKVNVIVRDHLAKWEPPGGVIRRLHRGFPVELAWVGPSPPEHLAWCSAETIQVRIQELPERSVLDVPRPRLRRLTELNGELLRHVAEVAPPHLEGLEARLTVRELAEEASKALAKLHGVRRATLATTTEAADERLTEAALRSALTALPRLERVQLSLPRLHFATIARAVQLVPELDVQFLVPWEDLPGRTLQLVVDPRRRVLRIPTGSQRFGEPLAEVLAALSFLGERLQVEHGSQRR